MHNFKGYQVLQIFFKAAAIKRLLAKIKDCRMEETKNDNKSRAVAH